MTLLVKSVSALKLTEIEQCKRDSGLVLRSDDWCCDRYIFLETCSPKLHLFDLCVHISGLNLSHGTTLCQSQKACCETGIQFWARNTETRGVSDWPARKSTLQVTEQEPDLKSGPWLPCLTCSVINHLRQEIHDHSCDDMYLYSKRATSQFICLLFKMALLIM